MARQLRSQLEQEASSLNELSKPLEGIRNPLNDLRNTLDAGSQSGRRTRPLCAVWHRGLWHAPPRIRARAAADAGPWE